MGCGVPVIGSSSGEIPEVIGDAGEIFKEGDVEDLINKIESLGNDPEKRGVLGQREKNECSPSTRNAWLWSRPRVYTRRWRDHEGPR